MEETLVRIADLLDRIARSVETIAASQRFMAEQIKKGSLDTEVAKERGRDKAP